MYLWSEEMKMAFYLCGLPPTPQSIYEKSLRQVSTEGHPTKDVTSIPQNYQGKSEKLQQLRATSEDMTA